MCTCTCILWSIYLYYNKYLSHNAIDFQYFLEQVPTHLRRVFSQGGCSLTNCYPVLIQLYLKFKKSSLLFKWVRERGSLFEGSTCLTLWPVGWVLIWGRVLTRVSNKYSIYMSIKFYTCIDLGFYLSFRMSFLCI